MRLGLLEGGALALTLTIAACSRGGHKSPVPELVPDDDDAGQTAIDDGGVSLNDAHLTGPHREDSGVTIWQPTPGTSWQWQLSGDLDLSFDVTMYDVDLFTTTRADIATLHRRGKRVVCYFDTAYEPERPDEARLRPYRGKVIEGWEDQNWLDIRAPQVVAVMRERIALAAQKGCDGVEADDVDVANNNSGFPLKQSDQRAFIRTLAREAHALGMAYGLKNALDDITTLIDEVDFSVNEECFRFQECDLLMPMIQRGKAVFHVEYPEGKETVESRATAICPEANRRNFDSLVKRLALDPPRRACR